MRANWLLPAAVLLMSTPQPATSPKSAAKRAARATRSSSAASSSTPRRRSCCGSTRAGTTPTASSAGSARSKRRRGTIRSRRRRSSARPTATARATTASTPEQRERVRGGGWDLPTLQDVVDQFVIHYDVCGTSQTCFHVLHDQRGLSVQFMLDVDGTIYQTLDLKERARHATISNNRSIGIEIANIGAYPPKGDAKPLDRWYETRGRRRGRAAAAAAVRRARRAHAGLRRPARPAGADQRQHPGDGSRASTTSRPSSTTR